MLVSLNEDCLLYICEFLNFSDQSALAHSSQRLQTIIENSWIHQYKKVKLDSEQCSWFDERKEYFLEFMRCICENVEELELENIKSETFNLLKELSFPKATKLLINFHYSGESSDDKDTELIIKLFPQLTKLSLCCGGATGKYLWNLKNLTELELGGCEDLETKYFKKIFSTLNLKKLDLMYYGYNTCFDELAADITECLTLEEIRIDDHHLLLLMKGLPKLKKLKKLTVYTRDYDTYLLEKIVERFGNIMDTVMFDDVFWSHDEHCESVKSMPNLRRLFLHDDDIEFDQLRSMGKSLSNSLLEFRFVKGRYSNETENGLIEFLNDCKNLQVFDISNSKIDINFLRKAIDKIGVDLKNRKKPLIFRCFNTNITEEDAELLTIPNRFQISLQKGDISFPGTRCFQCEWKLPEE